MYDIQSRNDFQSGATLVVKIPEVDLDQKAFYTILAENPDFVLPFRYKSIDDQIEFTYLIGKHTKLAYFSGNRSPSEYADLWFSILQPLIECGDWFMTPYSFVLQPEYLYGDKTSLLTSFVYIPSVKACSDYDVLKNMITNIAKHNHVTDVALENKVVWAIQDFSPNEFLQIIKPYRSSDNKPNMTQAAPEPVQRLQPLLDPLPSSLEKPEKSDLPNIPANTLKNYNDIVINLPPNGKIPKLKEEKPKSSIFGLKKEKKEKKPKPETKNKGGLFGKKKDTKKEIIQGAAAIPNQLQFKPEQIYPLSINRQPANLDNDVTQIEIAGSDAPGFRYVGVGDHPKFIDVVVQEGGVFTIGRFDVSVGIKQSDFEFDKQTKAISRHHAAIERNADGYRIIDLSSTAGTFLNDQKLPPNALFKLESGCHVSFGNSGANYIWEE